MTPIELMVTAIGLSMDAFAVAICKGLSMKRVSLINALIVGLYFGVFQAIMPMIGFMLGTRFESMISVASKWLAFGLLAVIGGRMITESFDEGDEKGRDGSLAFRAMLPLALATSIDALAAGVAFAFLGVGEPSGMGILPEVACIGATTMLLSMLGVKVGHVFGARFKSKAELVGGAALVIIGLKILLEHLLSG